MKEQIALVFGEPYMDLPKDLYIPPEALEVFLDTFEGPLDLLLYLIKRQNLDILDIPIAKITAQYMEYVDIMVQAIENGDEGHGASFELIAEYLVMAAMLAEIKSRMLLPKPKEDEGEEEDPRAELIRRLQEYEQFKQAATDIDELPRQGRDTFECTVMPPDKNAVLPPEVPLDELINAFREVLKRVDHFSHHHVKREQLSVRERMTDVLASLSREDFTEFGSLFTLHEGRMGVVVSLLAVLELVRESLIDIVQNEPLGAIYVRAVK